MEERWRGEFIHRVLYLLGQREDDVGKRLEDLIQRVEHETNSRYAPEEMKRLLLEFLGHEEVKPCFEPKPGRVMKLEQEFSDSKGNLFRMDRVVIDEDRVTVMDYKTGHEKKFEGRYISQLKNYMRILKEVYPGKKIEGMIAYVDIKEIVKIM